MKKVEFLFLSQQEVVDSGITMKDAISIAEGVLSEHGKKNYDNPPKPAICTRPGTFFHIMPGCFTEKDLVGMKWVSGFSENYKLGLPAIMGMVVLNDPASGKPLAAMDCAYITAVRTAASSAISAKYLATKDAKTVGIVGFGVQGQYHAMALKEVLPKLERILVYDINPDAVKRFKENYGNAINFELEAVDGIQKLIEPADVIVTSTGNLEEPIFMERWVKKGAVVIPVHMKGWEKAMYDKADKFILDDKAQYTKSYGHSESPYYPLPECQAELGEVVNGSKVARENDSERIVSINYGIVLHDIGLGTAVLEKAKEKGLGTTVCLSEEGDFPIVR